MIRRATVFRCGAGLAVLFGVVSAADAWVRWGPTWRSGSIVMSLALEAPSRPLIDGSTTWGAPAEAALAEWNRHLERVQFRVVRGGTTARAGDGVNSVFWHHAVYGRSFGGKIAVARRLTEGDRITEADVIFDQRLPWNSYRGRLRSDGRGNTIHDLRRAALHEFGHVLGFEHPDENGQYVRSIMNSHESDLESLTADDIAGARGLYRLIAAPPGPAAPQAPSAVHSSVAGNRVSLFWTSSLGATFYRLRITSRGAVIVDRNVGSTTSTTTTLSAGTYVAEVFAGNAAGQSQGRSTTFTIAGCAPPSTPSGLSGGVTAGEYSTMAYASWNPAPGATSYIVQAGSAPGWVNLFNGNVGNTTAVSADHLPRNFRAYVQVIAVNACGHSAPTAPFYLQ